MRYLPLTPDDRIPFRMTADGTPIYIQRKIFSECFYVMAMAEYARASGDESYLREAERMFALVWSWAFDWKKVGRPSYAGETPLQALAVPMILMNLIEELTDGKAAPYERELAECQAAFLRHVKPEEKRVYEFVRPDGSLCTDLPEGRQLNPGHAIEAGWFLQHWAERQHNAELSALAAEVKNEGEEHGHGHDAKPDRVESLLICQSRSLARSRLCLGPGRCAFARSRLRLCRRTRLACVFLHFCRHMGSWRLVRR